MSVALFTCIWRPLTSRYENRASPAANGPLLQAVEDGLSGSSAVVACDARIVLQHYKNVLDRTQLNAMVHRDVPSRPTSLTEGVVALASIFRQR